ncbi:hypothetical protein B5G21_01600, partial [Enorma massiliensis]
MIMERFEALSRATRLAPLPLSSISFMMTTHGSMITPPRIPPVPPPFLRASLSQRSVVLPPPILPALPPFSSALPVIATGRFAVPSPRTP